MKKNKENRNIIYTLYPCSKEADSAMRRHMGARRFVWNALLAHNREQYKLYKDEKIEKPPSTSSFSLTVEHTKLRNAPGNEWMLDLYSHVTRTGASDLGRAFSKLFSNKGLLKEGKGFPKFKSRHDKNTVSFPESSHFTINGNRINFGKKIGEFRMVRGGGNPHKDGVPRMVVVNTYKNKFRATVCYEIEEVERTKNGKKVGIDRNTNQFAMSDGDNRAKVRMPSVAKLETKKKRHQRKLSRLKKGSCRFVKEKKIIANISEKIAGVRQNFHHQESRKIADMYETVGLEKLNTRGMTRSAKGTKENPGTNVKAKSGLNREILASGWHGMEQKLKYKARNVVMVKPEYTSQDCNTCGHRDEKNRNGEKFKCTGCGRKDDADLNAADNILDRM